MTKSVVPGSKALAFTFVVAIALAATGCTSIRQQRGYIIDPLLYNGIHAGIDNERSVRDTLGDPTFKSQFGENIWYYVSDTNLSGPFRRPRIAQHALLAVTFDKAGNVVSTERDTGLDKIVYLRPDGAKTPTLGRERSFFEDLFGNIGQVGAAGAGANPDSGSNTAGGG